ncbi:hypothetical protein ACLB2K_005814 [Fragaria x ananassa]
MRSSYFFLFDAAVDHHDNANQKPSHISPMAIWRSQPLAEGQGGGPVHALGHAGEAIGVLRPFIGEAAGTFGGVEKEGKRSFTGERNKKLCQRRGKKKKNACVKKKKKNKCQTLDGWSHVAGGRIVAWKNFSHIYHLQIHVYGLLIDKTNYKHIGDTDLYYLLKKT